MYIPEGYGTVFPYMIVSNANALVEFLSAAFDASVEGKSVMPDGRVANTRVRIGTSTFMIGEASSDGMQAMPGSYYVFVEDVDTTFLNFGCTSQSKGFLRKSLDRQAMAIPTRNVIRVFTHHLL